MSWGDFDFVVKSLDEFKGEEEAVGRLKGYIEQAKKGGFSSLKHLIFYGDFGTGKTLAAQAFARQIFSEVVKIDEEDAFDDFSTHFHLLNSGDYRKHDFDKEIVPRLIQTDREKIVVFDEADALDPKIQMSMRALALEYTHRTKFIIIFNDEKKMDDGLKNSGRMQLIRFKTSDSGLREIAQKVIHSKNVKINEEKLNEIISEADGSPRRLIDALQDFDAFPTEAKKQGSKGPNSIKDDLGL